MCPAVYISANISAIYLRVHHCVEAVLVPTAAGATRGFGVAEFKQVGALISEVLNAVAQSGDGAAPLVEAAVKEKVKELTSRFPIYQ